MSTACLGYTTRSWIRTQDLILNGGLILGDLISHRKGIDEFSSTVSILETRTEPLGKVSICF